MSQEFLGRLRRLVFSDAPHAHECTWCHRQRPIVWNSTFQAGQLRLCDRCLKYLRSVAKDAATDLKVTLELDPTRVAASQR